MDPRARKIHVAKGAHGTQGQVLLLCAMLTPRPAQITVLTKPPPQPPPSVTLGERNDCTPEPVHRSRGRPDVMQNEDAVRLQEGLHRGEGRGSWKVMERGNREHTVEPRRVDRIGEKVGAEEAQAWIVSGSLTRPPNHLGRSVDPDDHRPTIGDGLGETPSATTDLENVGAGRWDALQEKHVIGLRPLHLSRLQQCDSVEVRSHSLQ